MNTTLAIRPSRDLRNNYSTISNLSRTQPVAITVNGKEDIVILSHEDYTANQIELSMAKSEIEIMGELLIAEQNVADGKTMDAEDARNEILSIFK